MFKAARWRTDKNKIKAVFKLQFKATQVPLIGWEAMMVTLVPVDAGKPSQRSEKTAIIDGACIWLNPVYETVKLTQDQKTGKISDKVYQLIVSATGSAKSRILGEININFADYAEVLKPTLVSLQLQDSNSGAILHTTIQRVQSDIGGRETIESGHILKGDTTVTRQRRTLQSQLSNPEYGEGRKTVNGANDVDAYEEESYVNSKALVKFHSSRTLLSHDDLNGNLRKSSSSDGISASGSESSLDQYTTKEIGIDNSNANQDNANLLPPLSNSDTPRNIDWSVNSVPDGSIAGSTNSSGEAGLKESVSGLNNILEKQKSELDALARQLEVSELELQTLRKQIMKENRRGQDLSRELSILKEERDALRKECKELKATKKRSADNDNVSATMPFGDKDPWALLEEIKEELDSEKILNATLHLQLQKTQDSNTELIFVVRDLEEQLEQKHRDKSDTYEGSQKIDYKKHSLHLRDLDVKQEHLEMTSDNDEEQCELDMLIKDREDTVVAYSQEQKIFDLSSELEFYKKDREDLEMQMEQLALDYEILKQENHDVSSRLEQMQLRDQLRIQYECSAHLAIINDLESHVEILENELEKQTSIYEANLAVIMQDKVKQEQRAILAEEELRQTKWKNANTVEQLQEEFKRLSSQMSTTFYANENLVMRTLEEYRELRLKKCHMGALLQKSNEELSSLQRKHQLKCQQLLELVEFKTKEIDRLLMELKYTKEELDDLKKFDEAKNKAVREEISILKAGMDQFSRDKSHLSAQIEEKDMLIAEMEILKASKKEVEMLLEERNLDKDMLEKEVSVLKEELVKLMEELNALQHLKDEQETTIETLNLKLQTLTTEYTGLKNCLSGDELEKENLRKQVFLLRGEYRKEADIIASIEKRLKDNNAKLTVSEGPAMMNLRNKGKRSFHASHGLQIVANLNGNSKPFEDDNAADYDFKDDKKFSVQANKGHLQEKKVEDDEFKSHSLVNPDERITSDIDASTKPEVESLVSCSYDQHKIADILSQMVQLKEQNETMEAELNEMQARYLEMSLKFAEVEGERQQLVIRIRSLKNSVKN